MKKKPPRNTFSVLLRPEAAEAIDGAIEEGETPAQFTAKALVFLAMKRKTGTWPRKLPPELLPRPQGKPKKKESSKGAN